MEESGLDSPEMIAFRQTLEKFADAMIDYSKKPEVKDAVNQSLKP